MTIKLMLKLSAMAMITAGIVLWRVHGNRQVRVLNNESQDPLNDLHRELCLRNTDCANVMNPREHIFFFPQLRPEGSDANVVLPVPNSWKSNCREWHDVQRLRTETTLGVGAYGHVAAAFDDNEREVALKSISKEALPANGENIIAREIEIMSSLNQENLIPLFASCETESEVVIIMEPARYGTVDALLGRNDDWLEEAIVAKIIACAARGICYMHERDVVHRDIKPDNLVITQWKPILQVKICDFGEALRMEEDGVDGHTGGTEGYCSPEAMVGRDIGPHVDMWSLGITLYELLFGELPFDQEDAADAEIDMVDRDLSSGARDLILKLLEKDPRKRINARDVLNHPWIKATTSVD